MGSNKSIVQIIFTHQSLKIFKVYASWIKLFCFHPKAIVAFRWEEEIIIEISRKLFDY